MRDESAISFDGGSRKPYRIPNNACFGRAIINSFVCIDDEQADEAPTSFQLPI